MTTLINQEIRPKRTDDVVVTNVAIKFAKKLHEWANEGNYEEYLSDATWLIKHINSSVDGYDLAKKLESKFCYSGDSHLVDICDDLYFIISDEHTSQIKEWVKTNNINPKYNIGDVVSIQNPEIRKYELDGKIVLFNPKNLELIVTGVIEKIFNGEAKYLVHVNNNKTFLIEYENVNSV